MLNNDLDLPNPLSCTADELMSIVTARMLRDAQLCFVGIGLPSTAANLARRTHAPGLVMVYESGCIGSAPDRLPLSIGDGDLADTADLVVSLPEVFFYWLQAGRIEIGLLGAAQIDRYGNLNSTVIGAYDHPDVRLPGAGGAPEISIGAVETIIIVRQSVRTFVEKLDFCTSLGHGLDSDVRRRHGVRGKGPSAVVSDLGVLRPDSETGELIMTELFPGVSRRAVRDRTGWSSLRFSEQVAEVPPPSECELRELRSLTAARDLSRGTSQASR